MRENADEEGNVVSYDVLMDAGTGTRESTMSVADVEMDIEHARAGMGSGGRGGDKNNDTSGLEGGSGSGEGRKGNKSGGRKSSGPEKPGAKGSGMEGVGDSSDGDSSDSDSGELSGGDEGRDKKVSPACCGHTPVTDCIVTTHDHPALLLNRVLIRRRYRGRSVVAAKWSPLGVLFSVLRRRDDIEQRYYPYVMYLVRFVQVTSLIYISCFCVRPVCFRVRCSVL